MSYETKDNSGALFPNDRRSNDAQPNSKGQALIGGVEYWVSGWTKTGKNGKWISLSFTEKEAKPDTRTHSQRKRPDDEMPF